LPWQQVERLPRVTGGKRDSSERPDPLKLTVIIWLAFTVIGGCVTLLLWTL
jgi:hypothetical protein